MESEYTNVNDYEGIPDTAKRVFLSMLSKGPGMIFEISELARSLNLSSPTVWLSVKLLKDLQYVKGRRRNSRTEYLRVSGEHFA